MKSIRKTTSMLFSLLAVSLSACVEDETDVSRVEADPNLAGASAPRTPDVRGPEGTADFNQWRGPRRSGQLSGVKLPDPLPKSLKKAWQVTVGEGHSTPVVGGERVYVLARQGEEEVALCLRLSDGSEVWRHAYPAPYEMDQAARSHGKGPKATPALHEGRLYTFGISGILTCIDAAGGEARWQKEFSSEFESTSPLYGAATSPIVDGDLVVVHVGGHDRGALRAFERSSGDVRWSWSGDGPAYTSPIVAALAGKRQLITQSQRHTLGVDPGDGKVLWQLPFKTPYDQNIVTPVVYGEAIIYSGLDQGTHAIRVVREGDAYGTETIWSAGSVSMYMSSPVLIGDALYGMSKDRKGRLFCIDAKSGGVRWQSDGRLGDNVALVHAGSLLWALTDGARLIVFRPDATKYAPVAEYEVADSPTWAHPVLVRSSSLIKDRSSLIRYDF